MRGGSFLLRTLGRITRLLRLKDHAPVRLDSTTVFLDLCDPRMLLVLDEVRGNGDEVQIMRDTLEEGDTFLDVGANHGSFSILAGPLIGQTGLVIAFEPLPFLAELIRKSLDANGVSRYEVHAVACCDRQGEADLYIPHIGSGSASIYKGYIPSARLRKIAVKTVAIDDAVGWQTFPGRIFMKIDAEGSELAVLRGAARMIRSRQPRILFEVNPTSSRAAGHSARDVLELLRQYGYETFAEVDEPQVQLTIREIDCTRQRNLLALLPTDSQATAH